MTTPGGSFTPQFSYADLAPIEDADPTTVTENLSALESAISQLGSGLTQAGTRISALEGAAPASTAAPTVLVNGGLAAATATSKGLSIYYELYANNAAALAAGLSVGTLYLTTTGEVRGVLPAGGGGTGGVVVVPTAPPSGTERISTATVTTPHYDGAPVGLYYWLWNKRWAHDSAYRSWSIFSADDNTVKFTVRAGDTFTKPSFSDTAGTERNRLVERNAEWAAKTDDHLVTVYVMVEGPVISSNFFQIMDLHTYGGTTWQQAEKFEVVIANERFQVTANANGAGRTPYTGTVPIVRGRWYKILIYVKSHTSTGRVIVEIDDTRVVDLTGYVGHPTETFAAWNFGIYRGTSSPEEVSVSFRDGVFTKGAFGTLTEPAAPPAPGTGQTYGSDILTNGALTTNLTGWTTLANTTASVVSTANGNFARLSNVVVSGGAMGITQIIATTAGAVYRVQGEFYRDTLDANASANVDIYQASSLGSDSSTSTTIDTFDFTFTADATNATVYLKVADAVATASYAYFRNVTVRKVL